MTEAPPSSKAGGQVGRRRRLAALVAGLAVAFLWLGCTVTEDNYSFLATFFDGVPDPKLLAAAAQGGGVVRNEKIYYQHKPYADDACDDCHRGAGNVMLFTARDDSALCLKCHEDAASQYPYMHGPVASIACRWCHSPHESTVRPLLRAAAPELCLQCHGLEMMSAPQPPEHVDLQRDCLECHFGHGGQDAYFLKPQETEEPQGTEARPDVEGPNVPRRGPGRDEA